MTQKNRIPKFKSIKEEADFWDTHDFTDFKDETKPVKVRVSPKLEHILTIRLDAKTLNDLDKKAQKKGIGSTTLIRMWVKEHLYA